MPFGIKTAPAIFQNVMEKLLAGFPGVEIYQDNIYVHASSRKAHNQRFAIVLERLKQLDFQLNKKKCRTALREINILGTLVNGSDAKPDPVKTAIIVSL